MNTQKIFSTSIILSSLFLMITGNRWVWAKSIPGLGVSWSENRDLITQVRSPEAVLVEREAWCKQEGGEWVKKSCDWRVLEMDVEREEVLNRGCSDRSGIWQTLLVPIYGSSSCKGDVCTLDLVEIDGSVEGVSCAWYPDINAPKSSHMLMPF